LAPTDSAAESAPGRVQRLIPRQTSPTRSRATISPLQVNGPSLVLERGIAVSSFNGPREPRLLQPDSARCQLRRQPNQIVPRLQSSTEDFIGRPRSPAGDLFFDFVEQEVVRAGGRICFELLTPLPLAIGIEPVFGLSAIGTPQPGDGVFDVGDRTPASKLVSGGELFGGGGGFPPRARARAPIEASRVGRDRQFTSTTLHARKPTARMRRRMSPSRWAAPRARSLRPR